MKIRLFSLLVFSVTASFTAAQEKEPLSYTQDIGFNTSFIFNGIFQSSSTPFSFMYKQHITENRVKRIGADISFNLTDTRIDTVSDQITDERYLNVSLSFGREFQNHLSEKWIWYYGMDIVPGISLSKYENHSYNYSFPTSYRSHSSTSYSLSARPFLGIRYNLTSRVYVAAEASATLTLRFAKTLET